MVPPSSLELSVMTTAPNQMMTKTSANWGPPSSLLSAEPPCSILQWEQTQGGISIDGVFPAWSKVPEQQPPALTPSYAAGPKFFICFVFSLCFSFAEERKMVVAELR